MLQLIYLASFLTAVICFPIQAHFFKKHISVYYSALFIAIIVYCFGCFQLSMAITLDQAIYANQTLYLGACFTPFFSFLCMADLLKVKIPPFIKFTMFLLSGFVFVCVYTVGYQPLYYKTVSLSYWHGLAYLSKEYGPLHMVYPAYIMLASVLSFVLIFVSFRRKRQIPYARCVILFIVLVVSFATYILERALKIKFELVPLAFNFEEIVILYLLNNIRLNDVSGLVTSQMLESNSYGVISFNGNGKFIGCEGSAKTWFPEVADLYVNHEIPEELLEKSLLLKQAKKWMEDGSSFENAHFPTGNQIIEARFSVINQHREKSIYAITLIDDTKQQKLNNIIKDYSENLEKKVEQKSAQLGQIQEDIILSMASIVENRDGNTGGHIKRTSDVMKIFVAELMKTKKFRELSKKTSDCIIKAATLHDFGKIGVPDSILNKPGKFTDEEYEIMKTHSEKGAKIVTQILQNSPNAMFNNIAINVAHYHHEKWDGTGYPEGKSGKDIPFEARVMALADVFDALVSKRVYKEQFTYDRAFKIIEESCGTHFDPDLCREFLNCRPALENLYNSYGD